MAKQYYCFLERFNNYFNRKLIRYDFLTEYQAKAKDDFIPVDANGAMTPFDFNPNDNITTEIIVNDVPFDPDYFLLLDADENIVSRWFVLEQKRNRKGQWLYFLRRDVLADSYNKVVDAPLYVERGIINNLNSPLLLNNEDLRVNQIKKEEILLKDQSESPWLVMYLKKGVLGTSKTAVVDIKNAQDNVYLTLSTPIGQWQYFGYSNPNTFYKWTTSITFRMDYCLNYEWGIIRYWTDELIYRITDSNPWQSQVTEAAWWDLSHGTETNLETTEQDYSKFDDAFSAVLTSMRTRAISYFGLKVTNPLAEFEGGKIVKDSDGKYWEVTATKSGTKRESHNVTDISAPLLKDTMRDAWRSATGQTTDNPNDKCFFVENDYIDVHLTITPRHDLETTFDFHDYTGKGTQDSMLFDAICIPYGVVNMYGSGGLIDYTTSPERSLLIMNAVAKALTSDWVLDLQILPFCPVPNLLRSNDHEVHISYKNDTCVVGVYSGEETDYLIVCDSANFSFNIQKNIKITDSSDVPSVYKRKYINDCSIVRLCAPNYAGVFEMNLAKNGGEIKSFNFDVTLRPYNPYIHVNPDFNFLYGQDFNDQRGLVCGGDYSLGIINDAWNVYEIQNKNYQAIFDRQIANLDVNNAINLQEATWGAVAGSVTGTASGAIAGGMVGGGYGAIAGAVIGAGASVTGGALDIQNLQKRQQEARNYAIDNFSLSLGNIRALPYSITKTSALTYNNKLFVFVEIYECSEEEKQAYYSKIKYNGMSVRKIDKMGYYTSPDSSNYFRAKLIRFTEISEDNHYLETINEELMKGVYI